MSTTNGKSLSRREILDKDHVPITPERYADLLKQLSSSRPGVYFTACGLMKHIDPNGRTNVGRRDFTAVLLEMLVHDGKAEKVIVSHEDNPQLTHRSANKSYIGYRYKEPGHITLDYQI